MPVYRIRVVKPHKKAPHYKIVSAPSIESAEYYALQHMVLSSNGPTLEDHFKMGYTPLFRLIARSEHKSIYDFQSDMIGRNSPASQIRIIRDNEAKPSVHDAREYENSIFELWGGEHDQDLEIAELPFFTPEDLEYFSSVIGRQFTKGDVDSTEIKSNLTEKGVFAKTHYWTALLNQKGFETEFRYDWQHSGRIRTYTWARVFLHDLKTPYVFFTVGVGSRFTENDEKVSTLEYKLDCRRDKLSQDKINLFDSYVEEFCPNSRRQKIQAEELSRLNWEMLVDRTVAFINKYKDECKLLTGLISDESNLPKKIVRLCWNDKGWEAPSGPFGKSKTSAKSFEKEKGYGHEEWFFETEKQVNGYHYAFVQAFNKGDHEAEVYEIDLYAIKDTGKGKEKYWIGRVKNLEVLTKEEAKDIVAIYKKRGWLEERLKQLNEFGIHHFNFEIIPENEIFNVRFKAHTSNYIRYEPYKLINNFEKEVGSRHYVLLDKKASVIDNVLSGSFQFIEGHNPETKKGRVTGKYSSQSYTKILLHEEMKENIYKEFKKQFEGTRIQIGTENPTGYGTSVDFVINDPTYGLTFYEIKTGGTALSCIREGLGQIVEYCYYPANRNASRLVIVSPHPVDANIKLYMRHLRTVLGIEIYYQCYSLDYSRLERSMV